MWFCLCQAALPLPCFFGSVILCAAVVQLCSCPSFAVAQLLFPVTLLHLISPHCLLPMVSTCNFTWSSYVLSYAVVLYTVYHCSHALCIPVCSCCFGCGVIFAYHFARYLMCSCWHVIVSEWCCFTLTVRPMLHYFALPLDLIDLPYSSGFSWHNIFMHFIIRHSITKVCLLEIRFRMVHGGCGSIGCSR